MPICKITVPCRENVGPDRENVVPPSDNQVDRSGLRELCARLLRFSCHFARFYGATVVPTSATRVPFSEKNRSTFVLTRICGVSLSANPSGTLLYDGFSAFRAYCSAV